MVKLRLFRAALLVLVILGAAMVMVGDVDSHAAQRYPGGYGNHHFYFEMDADGDGVKETTCECWGIPAPNHPWKDFYFLQCECRGPYGVNGPYGINPYGDVKAC